MPLLTPEEWQRWIEACVETRIWNAYHRCDQLPRPIPADFARLPETQHATSPGRVTMTFTTMTMRGN